MSYCCVYNSLVNVGNKLFITLHDFLTCFFLFFRYEHNSIDKKNYITIDKVGRVTTKTIDSYFEYMSYFYDIKYGC